MGSGSRHQLADSQPTHLWGNKRLVTHRFPTGGESYDQKAWKGRKRDGGSEKERGGIEVGAISWRNFYLWLSVCTHFLPANRRGGSTITEESKETQNQQVRKTFSVLEMMKLIFSFAYVLSVCMLHMRGLELSQSPCFPFFSLPPLYLSALHKGRTDMVANERIKVSTGSLSGCPNLCDLIHPPLKQTKKKTGKEDLDRSFN